jgi:PAS domain S-box-containing protein
MQLSTTDHHDDRGPTGPWWQAVPQAVVALDPRGHVLTLNPAARALLGPARADLVGRSFSATVLSETDQGSFGDILELVVSGLHWAGELGLAGTSRMIQVHLSPVVEDGAVTGVVLSLQTVDADRDTAIRLSERLTRLARVAGELLGAEDLKTLTDVVITHLADAAGAVAASMSVLVDDRTLALVGLRGGAPDAASRWATYPFDRGTPAGTALLDAKPLLLVGQDEIEGAFPGLDLTRTGDRTLLCLPLVMGERPLGVVSLSFPGPRGLDAAELEYYRIMADGCAQALERIHAVETVADQNAKLRLLAEASAELSRSLDYESTLSNVAWLAVPDFADWCSISLDQDGVLRSLAVAHKDPAQLALAREFEARYPAQPDAEIGNYQVLRTGETLLIPEITDEMLATMTDDPVRIEMVHRLGLRSAMTAALQARGRTFGTITWVSGETGRRFGWDDVAFGEDLARRAATAIDNALLHSELREIADRLQQAVRPPDMPAVDGWHLTASYSSAGRVSVGGDFYDAIPLKDGRLALAIGDVMGRGVQAAAAMSQIRAALRAFIAVDPDPQTVLKRLDLLYERFPTDELVTLLYAVADPAVDRVELICAGHPVPLLIRADGSAAYVEVARGTLLGVGSSHRPTTEVPFLRGDTLLMFTDGLVERRGEDLEVSEDRLREACRTVRPGQSDEELDRLAELLRDPTRDDDVAVLAVRREDVTDRPAGAAAR